MKIIYSLLPKDLNRSTETQIFFQTITARSQITKLWLINLKILFCSFGSNLANNFFYSSRVFSTFLAKRMSSLLYSDIPTSTEITNVLYSFNTYH